MLYAEQLQRLSHLNTQRANHRRENLRRRHVDRKQLLQRIQRENRELGRFGGACQQKRTNNEFGAQHLECLRHRALVLNGAQAHNGAFSGLTESREK